MLCVSEINSEPAKQWHLNKCVDLHINVMGSSSPQSHHPIPTLYHTVMDLTFLCKDCESMECLPYIGKLTYKALFCGIFFFIFEPFA